MFWDFPKKCWEFVLFYMFDSAKFEIFDYISSYSSFTSGNSLEFYPFTSFWKRLLFILLGFFRIPWPIYLLFTITDALLGMASFVIFVWGKATLFRRILCEGEETLLDFLLLFWGFYFSKLTGFVCTWAEFIYIFLVPMPMVLTRGANIDS